MRLDLFIRALGIFILSVSIGVCIYLYTTPYAEFLESFEGYFNAKYAYRYISPERYSVYPWIVIITALISAGMIIWSGQVCRLLLSIKVPRLQLKAHWLSIDPKIRLSFIILLVINTLARLYFAIRFPISYDEAWTYLHFSSKGVLTSLTYYPLPNNHILHSLLTNLSLWLPFKTLFSLRIPSLLAITLAGIALFFSFSKWLKAEWALVLLALFSSSLPVMYYGFLARGYSLILLAYVLCFHACIRWLREPSNEKTGTSALLFYAGTVIGVFTMPSFLYAITGLILPVAFFLLINANKRAFKHLCLSLFASGISCFLLYGPALMISGLDSIIGNSFVERKAFGKIWQSLYTHFDQTAQFLFHLPLWIVGPVLLLTGSVLIFRKQFRNETLMCMFIFLSAPMILLIHSVIPFPRTWIFLLIPFLYLLGSLFEIAGSGFKIKISIFAVAIAVCLMSVTLSLKKISQKESFSQTAQEVYQIVKDLPANRIYVHHKLLAIPLRYYDEQKGGGRRFIKIPEEIPLNRLRQDLSENELLISYQDSRSVEQTEQFEQLDNRLFFYKKSLN